MVDQENATSVVTYRTNSIRTLIDTPACGPSHSSAGQGVLQGSANLISEKEQFVRLWSHECLRIFHDRLVDDSDRVWFNHMLEEKVTYAVDVPLCVQMS